MISDSEKKKRELLVVASTYFPIAEMWDQINYKWMVFFKHNII